MRSRIVLSIVIAVLAAGCASTSITSYLPAANQEEWVSKILVGTWNGYIKSINNATISYNTPTLQIFWVERTPEGKWSIALSLNGKRIDMVELDVNNTMVRMEFFELYENLMIHHSLVLYGKRRLVGKIWYKLRYPNPSGAEVTFDKIY